MFKTILIVFLAVPCFSQSIFSEILADKNVWASSACAFTGGLADGTNQAIMFHYDDFKRVFPNANDQYWNPQVSWTNKYNNPFPGKKSFLVGTTDAYHMTRQIDNFATVVMMPMFSSSNMDVFDKRIPKKLRLRHIEKKIIEGIIRMSARQVGFLLTYDVLFKSH